MADNEESNCRHKFMEKNELESLIDGGVSNNTKMKVKWAVRTFESWRMTRIVNRSDEFNVYKYLDEMEKCDLNYALKSFVFEVRKVDGSQYPSESLRHLVVSIFHHLRHTVKRSWDFFKDPEFTESRDALDSAMKLSTKRGVGSKKRKAQFIPIELEVDLWDKNVI